MDPGVKAVAAFSVLLTAICLAFLFWSDPGSVAPTGRPLELRAESASPTAPQQPPRKADLFFPGAESDPPPRHAPIVLAPDAAEMPPPRGSDRFMPAMSERNRPSPEDHASWGTAAGVGMPNLHASADAGQDAAPRTHTVIDGDTLSSLAARYLGEADRYLEIYQWNSDVLANPDVLPIGQILRIPPRNSPRPTESQVIERPLVPITVPSG